MHEYGIPKKRQSMMGLACVPVIPGLSALPCASGTGGLAPSGKSTLDLLLVSNGDGAFPKHHTGSSAITQQYIAHSKFFIFAYFSALQRDCHNLMRPRA